MIGPFGLKPKGTMAVRALPLAKALARRGHAVAVFLAPWSHPSDSAKSWEDEGVRVENVAITPRVSIPGRLISRALAWRPDVIHCFKPKAYSGLAAWWLWQLRRVRRTRVRLVVDTDDWEGAGGWNEIANYSRAQKKIFEWQEQWGLRHADALTVASRALETIVLSMGTPRHQVHYLPNGVNSFARADASAASTVRAQHRLGNDLVFLLYTRFVEFQVERAADIFRRILQHVPNARLLVVGEGLHGEQEKLLTLAREQCWESQLSYAGWLEPQDLAGYFAAADLALYPFDDTLVNRCKCPVKLVDLLAAGVPVVAEAVGQNKEYITHNETGVLVPTGSVEELACAAVKLWRDEPLRRMLGANAAVAMARDYDWDKLVVRAEAAYQASA